MRSLRARVGRARLLGPALMGAALMAAMVPSAASADTDLAIGGDALLEGTPICQRLPDDTGQANAALGQECLPD